MEVKLDLIKQAIDTKKGEDIAIYDVSKTSVLCSYIIICTMLNGRHGKAICDEIEIIQEKLNQRVRHIEGNERDNWILIDLNDIIVHLFTKEEREHVKLDDLINEVHIHD